MANQILSPLKLQIIFKMHDEGKGTKFIAMFTGIPRKLIQENIKKLSLLPELSKEDIQKMSFDELYENFLK